MVVNSGLITSFRKLECLLVLNRVASSYVVWLSLRNWERTTRSSLARNSSVMRLKDRAAVRSNVGLSQMVYNPYVETHSLIVEPIPGFLPVPGYVVGSLF